MSTPVEALNSFVFFASLSVTIGILTITSVGMSLFSGLDQRATNVKVDVEVAGAISCHVLNSWADNALRLRLVYRELYFLKALAVVGIVPIFPVAWFCFTGQVAFGWLPVMVLFAVSLQVYRNALDNRLKALQA